MEIIVSAPDNLNQHDSKQLSYKQTKSSQNSSTPRTSPNSNKTNKKAMYSADAYDFGATLEQEKQFSSRFRRYKAKARNIEKVVLDYQNRQQQQSQSQQQDTTDADNDLFITHKTKSTRKFPKQLSEYKYLPPKHVFRSMNRKSLNESSRDGTNTRLLDNNIKKFIRLFENTYDARQTLQLQEASEHHQFLPKIRNFHTNLQAIVFVGKLRATVRRNSEGKTRVDYTQLRLQLRKVQKAVKIMEKNNCTTFDELEKYLLQSFDQQQISDIIQAILKDLPQNRTIKQKKLVGLWLQSRFIPKTKALKDRKLTEDDVQLLATNLTLVTLDANELLFRQGDMAKAFYMILDGSVGVLIERTENDSSSSSNTNQFDRFQTRSSQSRTTSNKPNKTYNRRRASKQQQNVQATKVASLPAGVSFGELGLLATNPKDAVRKATIIAETATTLIVMDSETFKTVVRFDSANAENEDFRLKKEFFQSFPMWSTLPNEMMMQLSIVTEKMEFTKGEMIIPFLEWQNKKQSHKNESIYWMKDGNIEFLIPKCIKSLPITSKKSIENYNKMIDSVLAWDPKNVNKHCDIISYSSGNQLLGLDRTILYFSSQSNSLVASNDIMHLPLAVRAQSKCIVYKMYLKNFFQFLQKTEPTLREHFDQLCHSKQHFCTMCNSKKKVQPKFIHLSQSQAFKKKRKKTQPKHYY